MSRLFDFGFGIWGLGSPDAPLLVAMGAPQQGAPWWAGLIMPAIILAIFYFIVILPMRRKQQKVQDFLAKLKAGDRVVTSGGLFGTITKVEEDRLQLQIADKVRVDVSRAAVVGFQGQEPVAPDAAASSS